MALPFAPSVTIVVPAFNERENLPRVLSELLAWGRRDCRAFEILVVDDGSSDGTRDAIPREPEIRTIVHERNQGLTATLRTGFFAARSEFVTWTPADGQIPPESLGRILDAWHGEDLVLSTYRHRPDGAWRWLLSRSLRVLVWLAIGFGDRLEGVYLFRRALLEDLALVARNSAGSIGFEIAAKIKSRGLRITSTEIECVARYSGVSKVANTRSILTYLTEIWRIRQSMR